MEKIPGAEAQAQKKHSSGTVPRAKPIPRHLVRTCHQVALVHYSRADDLSFLLAIEAPQKLKPERFFALLVAALRDG